MHYALRSPRIIRE